MLAVGLVCFGVLCLWSYCSTGLSRRTIASSSVLNFLRLSPLVEFRSRALHCTSFTDTNGSTV
ncbi:MFS multidrug transporter, putative [Anopheles sinensis]|uniref:MFS multidrug transporter, putative n=1 Tax=Anopheles sinensis TaxID=74873 RepID=A0A084VA98_ANOSI|nr:MFS multidrug transporter, putative [Anopheles sinensis]